MQVIRVTRDGGGEKPEWMVKPPRAEQPGACRGERKGLLLQRQDPQCDKAAPARDTTEAERNAHTSPFPPLTP